MKFVDVIKGIFTGAFCKCTVADIGVRITVVGSCIQFGIRKLMFHKDPDLRLRRSEALRNIGGFDLSMNTIRKVIIKECPVQEVVRCIKNCILRGGNNFQTLGGRKVDALSR